MKATKRPLCPGAPPGPAPLQQLIRLKQLGEIGIELELTGVGHRVKAELADGKCKVKEGVNLDAQLFLKKKGKQTLALGSEVK